MTRSFKFAKAISGSLRSPRVETVFGVGFMVTGKLDVGSTLARVQVFVPWRFRLLKHSGCTVTCSESWMKRGLDWHNFDTWMCWMLPQQWRDCMAWRGKSTHKIIREGSEWLIRSVRNLISRHYYAHLVGTSEWSSEWDAWKHDDGALADYQRETERANEARRVSHRKGSTLMQSMALSR